MSAFSPTLSFNVSPLLIDSGTAASAMVATNSTAGHNRRAAAGQNAIKMVPSAASGTHTTAAWTTSGCKGRPKNMSASCPARRQAPAIAADEKCRWSQAVLAAIGV